MRQDLGQPVRAVQLGEGVAAAEGERNRDLGKEASDDRRHRRSADARRAGGSAPPCRSRRVRRSGSVTAPSAVPIASAMVAMSWARSGSNNAGAPRAPSRRLISARAWRMPTWPTSTHIEACSTSPIISARAMNCSGFSPLANSTNTLGTAPPPTDPPSSRSAAAVGARRRAMVGRSWTTTPGDLTGESPLELRDRVAVVGRQHVETAIEVHGRQQRRLGYEPQQPFELLGVSRRTARRPFRSAGSAARRAPAVHRRQQCSAGRPRESVAGATSLMATRYRGHQPLRHSRRHRSDGGDAFAVTGMLPRTALE